MKILEQYPWKLTLLLNTLLVSLSLNVSTRLIFRANFTSGNIVSVFTKTKNAIETVYWLYRSDSYISRSCKFSSAIISLHNELLVFLSEFRPF